MTGLAIECATEHVEVRVESPDGAALAVRCEDIGHGHTRRLAIAVAIVGDLATLEKDVGTYLRSSGHRPALSHRSLGGLESTDQRQLVDTSPQHGVQFSSVHRLPEVERSHEVAGCLAVGSGARRGDRCSDGIVDGRAGEASCRGVVCQVGDVTGVASWLASDVGFDRRDELSVELPTPDRWNRRVDAVAKEVMAAHHTIAGDHKDAPRTRDVDMLGGLRREPPVQPEVVIARAPVAGGQVAERRAPDFVVVRANAFDDRPPGGGKWDHAARVTQPGRGLHRGSHRAAESIVSSKCTIVFPPPIHYTREVDSFTLPSGGSS